MTDIQRICFMVPITDMEKFREAQGYIEKLRVPRGVQVEIAALQAYHSMAESYNEAMHRKTARYKVYMHQDVCIIHSDFIVKLLDLFQQHPEIGIAGVVGSAGLPSSGVWWEDSSLLGAIFDDHKGRMAPYIYSRSAEAFLEAAVLDGLLLATQYDIPWREDIFTAWHFYDVSQCMEFRRRGYKAAVLGQKSPWCIHKCGQKLLGKNYEQERQKFVQVYDDLLPIAGREA